MGTERTRTTRATQERPPRVVRRVPQPALGATLGTNSYDQTYMERVGRNAGSIRTPDTALIRKMLRWKSNRIQFHATFSFAATGQWACEEYRFPIRMWGRLAREAGFIPKAPMTERKRLALEKARASSAASRRHQNERVASAL